MIKNTSNTSTIRVNVFFLVCLQLLAPGIIQGFSAPYIVKDIVPDSGSVDPRYLHGMNGIVYFATVDSGRELWRSDGTESGTYLVSDVPKVLSQITSMNGQLFFPARESSQASELWRSDGTREGTVLVKKDMDDLYEGFKPQELTPIGNTLFFTANDNVNGRQLWKSDGTEAGTVMVRDIYSGSAAYGPQKLTEMNGVLYFATISGNIHGVELWKSDGTEEGTVQVKDINQSGHSWPNYFTVMNGLLYFSAEDGEHGRELWRSDGTDAGTVLVKDIHTNGPSAPSGFTNVNGTLFFSAESDGLGRELWKSDGTDSGTVLVKDIKPSLTYIASSDPKNLIDVNGTLFFTADDGVHGKELWKSDGSVAGTFMVKDFRPNSNGASLMSNFTNVDGRLVFVYDGVLWMSDGTEAGTHEIRDLYPGQHYDSAYDLKVVGNKLYFSAHSDIYGTDLWAMDISKPPVVINDSPRVDIVPIINLLVDYY